MGEVVNLPARGRSAERFEAVKVYSEFGILKVTLARSAVGGQNLLALILDGLEPDIGFEILARVADSVEGRALADHMAEAVTMALMHVCGDDPHAGPGEDGVR